MSKSTSLWPTSARSTVGNERDGCFSSFPIARPLFPTNWAGMRTARERCDSDTYRSAVLRPGKQAPFGDDADRRLLLASPVGRRAESDALLHVRRLTPSHVHLLPRAPLEDVSTMMYARQTGRAGPGRPAGRATAPIREAEEGTVPQLDRSAGLRRLGRTPSSLPNDEKYPSPFVAGTLARLCGRESRFSFAAALNSPR